MTERKRNDEKNEHQCEECRKARGLRMPYSKWLTLTCFVLLSASWVYVSFILFSSKVEWHFAESLLFIEVIGLAAVTFLFVISYSVLNVIGHPLHIFIDEEGERHVHLKPPSKDFQLENQVLKIWLGGWFRRNELDGPGSAAWQVPRAIIPDIKNPDEWLVTVRDFHDQEITLNPWKALSITRKAHLIDRMLERYREKEFALDFLGTGLIEIMETAKADKKTYGRSKAVMKMRTDLLGLIAHPVVRKLNLEDRWRRMDDELVKRLLDENEAEETQPSAQA